MNGDLWFRLRRISIQNQRKIFKQIPDYWYIPAAASTGTDMIKIYFSLDDITYFTVAIDNAIEVLGGNAKIINVTGTGRYVRIKYHNLSTGTLTLSNCSVSAIGAPIA